MPTQSPTASRAAGQRGAVLIYVAIMAVVLVGLAGIALDAASIRLTSLQLQNVADGSALAAARLVIWEANGDPDNPFELTRQAARNVAASNSVGNQPVSLDPNTDVVIGRWDPDAATFTPDNLAPNAVRVYARRTMKMPFASLKILQFGSTEEGGDSGPQDITSDVLAVATATTAGTESPLLLVRDPSHGSALALSDGATLDVGGGQVRVNSSDACALNLSGGAFLNSQETKATGGYCTSGGSAIAPGVHDAQPLSDPLSSLLPTLASWDGMKAQFTSLSSPADVGSSPDTLPHGTYPNGLVLGPGQHVMLEPDQQYVFGGPGLVLSGGASVEGLGVTIFIDEGARLEVSGPSSLMLTAPARGDFEGIAIFHHRENGMAGSGPAELSLSGSGLYVDIQGTVYLPAGRFQSSAYGHMEFGELIVRTIKLSGSGEIDVAGEGMPSFGTPFLVE